MTGLDTGRNASLGAIAALSAVAVAVAATTVMGTSMLSAIEAQECLDLLRELLNAKTVDSQALVKQARRLGLITAVEYNDLWYWTNHEHGYNYGLR